VQLGIGSYTYSWAVGVPGYLPAHPMTAGALLEQAHRLDVPVVQIADNLPLHVLSAADREALARRARELGIQIEVGTRGIARAHLRTYIELAARFASPILRVVVDTVDHHPPADEVVATLRAALPKLREAGVCLAVENHDRFPVRVLRHIVEAIDSAHVGICLDPVNSFGSLEGPEVVLETLGPWVVNLHVKDFTIYRADHKMGFTIEGRPAGEGMLDVPWLLERLREMGRDPNAIVELWTPPENELAETIRKEAAWAERSVAYLRRLIPPGAKPPC